jgi:hypothetical protein
MLVRTTYKVNMTWWKTTTRGRLQVRHFGSPKHVTAVIATDASDIRGFVHSRVAHSYIAHGHSCSTAHTLKSYSTFFSKDPMMAENLLKSLNSAQTRCVFQVASCSIIHVNLCGLNSCNSSSGLTAPNLGRSGKWQDESSDITNRLYDIAPWDGPIVYMCCYVHQQGSQRNASTSRKARW